MSFYQPVAPAGSNTQIQYNKNGGFGGDADLTWDDSAKELGVGGDINLDDGGTYETTVQVVTPTANRTISFPDATGTVALVAGSSGQLTYNSAGAQAGLTSASIGSTGEINVSLAGAASTPPVSFTGSWFTGGTATTTKPQLLIEPTGTTSTAWSTSGTGLGVNAASGFSGRLLDLQLNGTSNFSVTSTGSVSVPLGSNTSPSVYFGTDTNTGIYSPGADQVAISTGGTGRLFVDSSGKVGVGATPSGTGQFHVINTAGNVVSQFLSQPSGTCTIYLGTTSTADSFLQYDDSASFLRWYEGGSERLRITSDAYVRLASGTGGIQFNGDTAAANALDDYEEGTFTPTIAGTTAAGTATYATQAGKYTKIGNTVVVTCRLEWSSHTGTGSIYIAGLPFTPAGQNALGSIYCGTLSFVDGIVPRILTGQTRVYPYNLFSGGSASLVNITAGGIFDCTVTYYTS